MIPSSLMSAFKVNFVCATEDVLGVSSNSGEVPVSPDPPPEHEAVSSGEELTVIS